MKSSKWVRLLAAQFGLIPPLHLVDHEMGVFT